MKRNNDANIKPYISKRKKKDVCPSTSSQHSQSLNHAESDNCNSLLLKEPKGEQSTFFRIPQTIIDTSNVHKNVISSLSWHPTLRNVLLSSSYDKTFSISSIQQKKFVLKSTSNIHSEAIKSASWDITGSKVFTASYDKTSKLYDINSGVVSRQFDHEDHVTSLHVHPSQENIFLTGTTANGIYSWDVRKHTHIRRYASHFGEVQDLLFLPDDKSFVSSAEFTKKNSLDKTLTVWDYSSGVVMSNYIYQEPYTCSQLKLHPDGKSFLANSSAGYIAIFNSQSPWKLNKHKRYEGHQSGGYSIGFDVALCGSLIFCGDSDGLLLCYDAYTSRVKQRLSVSYEANVRVAKNKFHPSLLVCGTWNGGILLFE